MDSQGVLDYISTVTPVQSQAAMRMFVSSGYFVNIPHTSPADRMSAVAALGLGADKAMVETPTADCFFDSLHMSLYPTVPDRFLRQAIVLGALLRPY